MGLNWLITGGCGFIGRNLVKNLLKEEGHTIRIIDNLTEGTESDLSKICNFVSKQAKDFDPMNIESDVLLVIGDILDSELADKATKDIDVIVHLAANTGVAPSVENPRKDCDTNIFGTLNYLEAARKNNVQRFIFASSGAPAGEIEPPIHEEIAPHPVSPYGASKLAGEGYCSAYFRTFKVETIALRFGNVYGPYSGHKDSVVAKFTKKMLNGESLEIYGDGSQTRDFIYIDDLINAVRLAQSSPNVGGEVFQIASNRETTINELADMSIGQFKQLTGRKSIDIKFAEKRKGDVQRNYSDTSKARNLLNWQPQINLEVGLSKTIKWFLDSSTK